MNVLGKESKLTLFFIFYIRYIGIDIMLMYIAIEEIIWVGCSTRGSLTHTHTHTQRYMKVFRQDKRDSRIGARIFTGHESISW